MSRIILLTLAAFVGMVAAGNCGVMTGGASVSCMGSSDGDCCSEWRSLGHFGDIRTHNSRIPRHRPVRVVRQDERVLRNWMPAGVWVLHGRVSYGVKFELAHPVRIALTSGVLIAFGSGLRVALSCILLPGGIRLKLDRRIGVTVRITCGICVAFPDDVGVSLPDPVGDDFNRRVGILIPGCFGVFIPGCVAVSLASGNANAGRHAVWLTGLDPVSLPGPDGLADIDSYSFLHALGDVDPGVAFVISDPGSVCARDQLNGLHVRAGSRRDALHG